MHASAGFQQRRAEAIAYRFRMIGRFEIEPFDRRPTGKKACALLAYLALARRSVDRRKVTALLWSERGDQQARASLRQCLIELRALTKSLPPLLRADRQQITLDNSMISTDLDAIIAHSGTGDAARLSEILPRAGDVLLDGLDGIDPAYDDWLAIERAHRHDQIERSAIACGETALAAGDSDSVRILAARLAEFDPVNEAAARLEMTAAAQSGDRDGVRRVWRRIEHALAADLGVQPAEETRALFKQLMEAPAVRPDEVESDIPGRKVTLPRGRKMQLMLAGPAVAGMMLSAGLALHPGPPEAETIIFEQVMTSNSNAADKAFASQMSGDFQRLLSTIERDIKIADKFPSKSDRSFPDLLVRTRVSRGSEQTNGSVQLVSTRENAVLWSGSYSNDQDDLSNLGLQAAGELAAALRCAFRSLSASDPFRDEKLSQLTFSACGALFKGSDQSFIQAETLARQLVKHNPKLSVGWTLLASAELEKLQLHPTEFSRQDAARLIKRARGHAIRSLRLDPQNGNAYIVLAETLDPLETPRSLDSRLKVLEAGLRADPDNPELLLRYGVLRFASGYAMSALAPTQKALKLDPTSPAKAGALVRRLMSIGSFEEAFGAQLRSESISPNDDMVKMQRLRMMCEQGDPQAAMALYAKISREHGYPPPTPPLWHSVLKWRVDPASLDLAQMEQEARKAIVKQPEAANYVAAAFARVGEIDHAFRFLESSPARFSQHSILFWPDAATMRRDPRFFLAMDRIGLVDMWVRRGQWPDFCADPLLAFNCSAEAAKLGKQARRD